MAGKYTAHHPKLPDRPGTNWVEKAGGLPPEIDAVARALRAKGYSTSRAIATAVNHVKKVCATGRAFGGKTPVSAEARAKACSAAARWEAMKASTSIPADVRRAIELAEKRYGTVELATREVSEGTLRHAVKGASKRGLTMELSRIDMAAPRAGLVPVKVKVTNRKGTTFERTMYVRPNQAKAATSQKGGQSVTVKGRDVQRQERTVLQELAKVPRDQRPAGWDEFVRQVASGASHGGRLGPAKRRALRELQKNAPEGSPLKAAVTGLLKSDAAPKKQVARERTRTKAVRRRRREKKTAGFVPRAKSGFGQTR